MDLWEAPRARPKHLSVTMDTVVLEEGTEELLPLRGRVVVVYPDMDTPGAVCLMELEHNQLVG